MNPYLWAYLHKNEPLPAQVQLQLELDPIPPDAHVGPVGPCHREYPVEFDLDEDTVPGDSTSGVIEIQL